MVNGTVHGRGGLIIRTTRKNIIWEKNNVRITLSGRREWIGYYGHRHLEFFKDGMHGKWEGWYENGQRWFERHYHDGVEHGTSTTWFDNGQIWDKIEFQKGRRHGKCEGWYSFGRRLYEGYYQDDELHGECTSWDIHDQPHVQHFRNGVTTN